MNYQLLKDEAILAADKAYAPYSGFKVGAALLCEDGTIIRGCNVENRSYGLTICAERNAIFHAVSLGYTRFKGIAIFSPQSKKPLPPCGACRQVISEFCDGNMLVFFGGTDGDWIETNAEAIIPFDSLHDLKNKANI